MAEPYHAHPCGHRCTCKVPADPLCCSCEVGAVYVRRWQEPSANLCVPEGRADAGDLVAMLEAEGFRPIRYRPVGSQWHAAWDVPNGHGVTRPTAVEALGVLALRLRELRDCGVVEFRSP